MTSRDFRAIAATIADLTLLGLTEAQRETVAKQFAYTLASTNSRFDRDRFMAAATGGPLTPGDKPRARDFAR